jgi:hypothetical protein
MEKSALQRINHLIAPHAWDILPVAAPDFLDHCLQGGQRVSLDSLAGIFRGILGDLTGGLADHPCSNLDDLHVFFSIIWKNARARDLGLAEGLAAAMVERNWTLESLDRLPLPLAIPIREVLRICQIGPRMTYPLETYKLIDRADLFEFVRGASTNYDITAPESDGPVRSPLFSLVFLMY